MFPRLILPEAWTSMLQVLSKLQTEPQSLRVASSVLHTNHFMSQTTSRAKCPPTTGLPQSFVRPITTLRRDDLPRLESLDLGIRGFVPVTERDAIDTTGYILVYTANEEVARCRIRSNSRRPDLPV
jgi:hypothetical protein